jgi:DNA-binding response OmpR family regulator
MNKILLIEDEMRLHKMFENVFKEAGFELISAYDGITGLQLAEEKSPCLILLDLILPRKNGFEVLSELKKNPRLASIPIVILTNLEGPQDVEKAFSLGAYIYLVKSNYSIDELLEKIKEIIAQNES